MRPCLVALSLAALLAALPAGAEGPGRVRYQVQLDKPLPPVYRDGTMYVTVQFRIQRVGGEPVTDVADEIRVEEDGHVVAGLETQRPGTTPLTTVLALDVSGSMEGEGRLPQSQRAAKLFLDKLSPRADCGLILFDHKVKAKMPLAGQPRDAARWAKHLQGLRDQIDGARPGGGTAYFDAAVEAIELLKDVKGRKAVVLLTDGVDLNSKATLAEVIALAKSRQVAVYTVGVGEPGKQEPVSSVLVLDCSGSMTDPAEAGSKRSKLDALKEAAGRFVGHLPARAKTTLLPFSSTIPPAGAFTNDKEALGRRIDQLRARGATRLFDATDEALRTLQAARPAGRQHVVVMTDGKNEGTCRLYEPDEVVAKARKAGVRLHMLGFGQAHQIDEKVMRGMADATGGSYARAGNDEELVGAFEKLSFALHDDGIDEKSLRQLADDTGGKYFHVKNAKDLQLSYADLAEELQTTYTVTFPSRRPTFDSTLRGIKISVWHEGVAVSEGGEGQVFVPGVIVPDMDARVYLVLLAVLAGLAVLPAGLRRWLPAGGAS